MQLIYKEPFGSFLFLKHLNLSNSQCKFVNLNMHQVSPMSKALIIVHGLYMSPLVMKVIERRFHRLGYITYNFGYPSRRYSEKTLQRLHTLCESINEDEIYFLGHSMGGIVINHYLSQFNAPEKFCKIVTLGTPYNGSRIVKYFAGTTYGELLFGHERTKEVLVSGVSQITPLPIGVIIGTKNIGVGIAFGINDGDGTVALDEATLPWATDHFYLPLSHTALIYSKRAVILADNFFRKSRFI
jgi:pimeloyl-ACP methyl ester carboxylesterase